MARPALALTSALFLASCLPLVAQLTTSQVTFRNQGDFAQADLEQVAGLHAGDKTSHAGVIKAAQRLIDTGFFDDVKVDSKGPPSASEIIFILRPEAPAKGSAVGFENFVWLTPEELQAAVHKAAPLFHGRLPAGGNEADVINDSLQDALDAKGVDGTVTYEPPEPTTERPERVTDYRVDPPVTVGKISVSGTPAELKAAQDRAAEDQSYLPYNEGLAGETTIDALLAPARDAGCLAAKLTNVQRTVREGRQVDVTATLVAGPVYRVAKISAPPDTRSSAAPALRPGDIASRKKLLLTVEPIEDFYKKQGYMDVYINPMEALDPVTHTVSYNLTVVPGEVYHLHSVQTLGLSPEATADFNKAWTMKPGDIYNAGFVDRLMENSYALKALATYKATFRTESDPTTHLVDLTIKFEPNNISTRH